MIGLQALKAAQDRVHDVAPGGAPVVGPGAHLPENLGGDDHVLAHHAEVFEGLA